MFGIDSGELFLIALVAIAVIGPKDLPRVMRTVGQWVAKARGMANHFRAGVDQMVRESEIADLEKKWREQNEAIMRANPMADTDWGVTPQEKKDWAAPAEPSEPEAAAVGAEQPTAAFTETEKQPVLTAGGRRRPVAPPLVKPAQRPVRAASGAEQP